ncbi:6-bladed beta-propeller [candidate division KSB1 bacterium]
MKRLVFILSVLSFIINLNCSGNDTYTEEIIDGVRHVHNLAPEWGDEQRLNLELVQKIGQLEGENENYMLYKPIDVAVDAMDNIYIFEMGERQIKKFSRDGKYITSIGRAGQGPDEFDVGQQSVEIDKNGFMYIPSMSGKIKILTPEGKYSGMLDLPYPSMYFKLLGSGNIIFSSYLTMKMRDEDKDNLNILTLFSKEKNEIIKEFSPGIDYGDRSITGQGNIVCIDVDRYDNIYISYNSQNRIEKYNPSGELLLKIDMELPYTLDYEVKDEEFTYGERTITTKRGYFANVSGFIGIDSKNRIWNLYYRKQIEEEEKETWWRNLEYGVFDNDGVLLTYVPIPDHYFDNIQQFSDRLFFVDPFREMCVYEYRIVEK